MGWHAQIKDEPALVLSEQRIWRATLSDGPIGTELLPEAKAALGNVFTYAGAGITLRLGQQLDADWGPARIAPAMEGSDFVDFNRIDGIAWNIFAGVEGRLVARNITLDGNAFQDSASVAKIPVVGDLNAGAAFLFNRMRVSMSFTFRSREFKTQQGNDNFASVAISYSY